MSAEVPAVSVPISTVDASVRDADQNRSSTMGLSESGSDVTLELGGRENSSTDAIIDEEIADEVAATVVALPEKEEGKLAFLLQTCVPFLLAGLGMVGAGMLLHSWQDGLFLRSVPEAFVLIPALLGLKGNLEMTLASRLSTMAHLGQIDGRGQKVRAFYSNMAVDQAQAIVVSMVASLLAIGTRIAQGYPLELPRALCLMLASTLTATVTSLVLASLMLSLTFAARTLRINPDNISTPIAAALGDLTSLASLLFFGTKLYPIRETMAPWLLAAQIVLLSSSLLWMWMASREEHTRKVLKFGWFPVLAAMCLSSAGGSILEQSIARFEGIALFQPLINGVGGNLVAVQSSKISTHLFRTGKYGRLPANRLLTYLNPLRTFRCKERESMNALILLGLAVPGHLLFLALICLANNGVVVGWLDPGFVLAYLLAALLQVALLLYLCQLLCRALWLCRLNPDLNSIPLLTALGDLLGSLFLAAAFALHASIN